MSDWFCPPDNAAEDDIWHFKMMGVSFTFDTIRGNVYQWCTNEWVSLGVYQYPDNPDEDFRDSLSSFIKENKV